MTAVPRRWEASRVQGEVLVPRASSVAGSARPLPGVRGPLRSRGHLEARGRRLCARPSVSAGAGSDPHGPQASSQTGISTEHKRKLLGLCHILLVRASHCAAPWKGWENKDRGTGRGGTGNVAVLNLPQETQKVT